LEYKELYLSLQPEIKEINNIIEWIAIYKWNHSAYKKEEK